MANNFIQRPRLFNPAAAYQTGKLARNRFDAGQITNQTNAFNLQRAQERAPMVDQQDAMQLQQQLQALDANTQKMAISKLNQARNGLDAFLSMPQEQQAAEYPRFYQSVAKFSGGQTDLPQNYDPVELQSQRQTFDYVLGPVERDMKLTEVGAPGGQKQRAWVDPARPEYSQRVGAPYSSKPLVQVGSSGQVHDIPPVLLTGLSASVAAQTAAAYKAAGGGKDGLVAANKVMNKGTTQERRRSSVNILKTAFPKASPAELQQMQGSMDAAKDNESGLKAATTVREEQRRLKKAKVFQERAVILLDKILSNPELNDVLGSLEGSDKGYVYGDKYRSDLESEAMADIEEAQNILTADNLKLMSGVLSETDIKILTNLAGGALNRRRGESRFKDDVTTLKDKLSSQLVQTVDDRQSIAPSGRQGGKLHVDAQGNRAWVFPDGSFEEVQ